jgi:hypothetical protein
MYRCWLPLCHGNRLVHTHRAIGVVDAVGRARRWRCPSEILSEVFGPTRAALRRHINQVAHAFYAPDVSTPRGEQATNARAEKGNRRLQEEICSHPRYHLELGAKVSC